MLTIDRLRLRMPAALAGRARHVAPRLATELGRIQWNDDRSIASLRVEALPIRPEWSDARIARTIADAIRAGVEDS